jgi:hypothetical protein
MESVKSVLNGMNSLIQETKTLNSKSIRNVPFLLDNVIKLKMSCSHRGSTKLIRTLTSRKSAISNRRKNQHTFLRKYKNRKNPSDSKSRMKLRLLSAGRRSEGVKVRNNMNTE